LEAALRRNLVDCFSTLNGGFGTRFLRTLRLRVTYLLRGSKAETDLNDELQDYIERQTEQHVARGLSREQARIAALRDMGGVEPLKESCRDQRGLNALDDLQRDMRFAIRVASRNPLFSLTIVLSLALGVAATSAIFSVVCGMLVNPFPYRQAESISVLTFRDGHDRSSALLYPASDYQQIAGKATNLQDSFAFKRTSSITTRGLPESVIQIGFSQGAFRFFGVPMLKGRPFGASDVPSRDEPPNVIVLSHTFWMHHYSGAANVIGKALELDHQLFTIIGIAPPRFTWSGGDVFTPLRPATGGGPEVNIAVRPLPGLSMAAVNAQIDSLTHHVAELRPGMYPRGTFQVRAVSMTDQMLGNVSCWCRAPRHFSNLARRRSFISCLSGMWTS
jgi:hypothetical protein